MYEQLRETDNQKLYVTYLLCLCCIAVTGASIAFPNLQSVYGGFEEATYFDALSFVFYHGFDNGSALIHLAANLGLLIMLGGFVEKCSGRTAFLFLAVMFVISNGLTLRFLSANGIYHVAATGFIWFLLPTVQYILIESRRLKTRVVYEDYFRFIRGTAYFTAIVPPLIFVFVQFIIRGDITYKEAIIKGLVPFADAYGFGFIFMMLIKNSIRSRLKLFVKKKKFGSGKYDKMAGYILLGFPLYLIIVFLQ
jgi:hypothetical protein